MIHNLFRYVVDRMEIFLVVVIGLFVVFMFTMMIMFGELPEKDYCESYKYSKVQDVPAVCLKYFQE